MTKRKLKKQLKRLQRGNEWRVDWQNRVWNAIDKLPDDTRRQFLQDAELTEQAAQREMTKAMCDHVAEQMRDLVSKSRWFIQGGGKQNINARGSFEWPDELEPRSTRPEPGRP